MTKEVDNILLSLFNIDTIEQLDRENIQVLAAESPYASFFQFLQAINVQNLVSDQQDSAIGKIAMHFPDNLWILDLIHKKGLSQQTNILAKDILPQSSPATASIPIDPYHTVDYFASQGIKLSQLEQGDPLGNKLKSFTAWLKTMKKLQPQEKTFSSQDNPPYTEDSTVSAHELATTEAMAEVYIKQGLREKAIEVYTKLSLQNPANSHIFADKIAALNENRL